MGARMKKAIDKLVETLNSILSDENFEFLCDVSENTGNADLWAIRNRIQRAVEEYERTKHVEFPVELVIPEWVEWFTVDSLGFAEGWETCPWPEDIFWTNGERRINLGECEEPDDWKTARWHKEDGKWVQK